jgi:phage terminase small subunit
MQAAMTLPIRRPIEPPPGLPPDVAAEFERLAGLLVDTLRPEDSDLLGMYATAIVTWRTARATVAAEGERVMSGGTCIANPSLAIAAQAHREILALAKQLRIGPASASRKRTKAPRPQDGWLA